MKEAYPYILVRALIDSRNKVWKKHIHTSCQDLHGFQELSMKEAHPNIFAWVFTVSRNKVWKKHIHEFLPGPSQFPGTKNGGGTSIHSCQGLHCLQSQRMEAHLYILARAFTVSRKKDWKKNIHIFLPGPSLFPGTKYGRSTSIHSCKSLHCFQEEQSMEEAHPYILAWALTVSRNKVWRKHIHKFFAGPSLTPETKYGGSTSIHHARAFTVSRNKVWRKHIHTFFAGPSLIPETKYGGSTSIHHARAFTDSMSKVWRKHIHTFFRVVTVSRNKVWRKHIHTFLPGSSLFPGTKYGGSTSMNSCQGLH